jgi:hypothetical protein
MRRMLKKALKYIGTGIFALLAFNSCTDLDEHVYDQLLEGNFYKDDNDLALAMSPVYADLRTLFDWQRWWDLQESADICMTPQRPTGWYDGGVYQRLHWHAWTPDDVHLNNFWDNAYYGISTCNRLISQIINSPYEIANSEAVLAEVKSVRALWYYLLCDTYGNIPLSLSYDIPSDSLLPTTPRIQVLQFIINDLKSNLPYLNEANDSKTYGRMSKWAASFLLAKAYLNSEAWVGTAKYDSCSMVCDSLLAQETLGTYKIESSYPSLFSIANEGYKEAIFTVPMDELIPGAIIYFFYRKTLHGAETQRYHFQCWIDNGVVATPSWIDTYDPEDLRLDWNIYRGQRYDDKGDTLRNTSGVPVYYPKDVPSMEAGGEFGGYRLHKYEIEDGISFECNNDWVWFRLAEVKFMKAECLLRTGGDAQTAADLVNSVRQRAFPAAVWADKKYTAEDLTATVEVNGVATPFGQLLKEYGWEFCWEGSRREQLVRFGNFTTGSWTFHAPDNDPNKNLFPIPTSALNANPILIQNPGY